MSVVRSEPAALRRRMGWPSLTRIALDDHWQWEIAVRSYREMRVAGFPPSTARRIVWTLLIAGERSRLVRQIAGPDVAFPSVDRVPPPPAQPNAVAAAARVGAMTTHLPAPPAG